METVQMFVGYSYGLLNIITIKLFTLLGEKQELGDWIKEPTIS